MNTTDKIIPSELINARLVHRFDFSSYQAIANQGGTISGTSCTLSPEGATLAASTSLWYQGFNPVCNKFRVPCTLVFEFTLNFTPNDGAAHMLLDSADTPAFGLTKRFYIYKYTDDGLYITVPGGNFAIPWATWSPYYSAGRNALVISAMNANTRVHLNGNLIAIYAGPTVSHPSLHLINRIVIGGLYNGTLTSPMIVHKLDVYDMPEESAYFPNEPYLTPNNAELKNEVGNSVVTLDLAEIHCVRTGVQLGTDYDLETPGVGLWLAGNNATFTKETGTPYSGTQCGRVAYNGTNYPYVYNTSHNGTIGRRYYLSGYARGNGGAGYLRIFDGGAVEIVTAQATASWQKFETYYTAVSTKPYFFAWVVGAAYADFDAVTWEEVDTKTPVLGKIRSYDGVVSAPLGLTGKDPAEFPTVIINKTSNKGLYFNASQQITVSDNPRLTMSSGGGVDKAFSLLLAARIDDVSISRLLVSKATTTVAGEFLLYSAAGGNPTFRILNNVGGSLQAVNNGPTLKNAEEFILACVYDGTKLSTGLRIYKNGLVMPTTNTAGGYTGMVDTATPLVLGAFSTYAAGNALLGRIYHFEMFDEALSPMRVLMLTKRLRDRL